MSERIATDEFTIKLTLIVDVFYSECSETTVVLVPVCGELAVWSVVVVDDSQILCV